MDFQAGEWTADDNGDYYLKYQCRVDSTSSKTSSIAASTSDSSILSLFMIVNVSDARLASIYTVLEGGTVSCLQGPTASPKTTTTHTPHLETNTATTGTSTFYLTAGVDS